MPLRPLMELLAPHHLILNVLGAPHSGKQQTRAHRRKPHGLGEAERTKQCLLPAGARDPEQRRCFNARVPCPGYRQE